MALRDLIPWTRSQAGLPARRTEERPIFDLQREVNRLFDDFFGRGWMEPFEGMEGALSAFTPRVDVTETEKEVHVKAELPGMTEKDVEVSITEDALVLKGERKHEEERREANTYRRECSYGSFHRTIPLPCEVLSDKAEAVYKNGVLEIKLPKTPAAESHRRKIPVKSA